MANMFDQAKKAAPAATKAGKKDTKRQVKVAGLATFSMLDDLIKSLSTLRDTKGAEIKGAMLNEFVTAGMRAENKPESFRGIDGDASASCELRRRSSRSVLSESEAGLLAEYNVPVETAVKTVETFVINPAHAKDDKLLQKVAKALEGIDNIPEDFIQYQAPVTADIATDDSIRAVCSLKEKKLVKMLLPLVTTMAIKPRSDNVDINAALNTVKKLLSGK